MIIMIRQLQPGDFSKFKRFLFDQLGDASLEWLYCFEKAGDTILVYCDESFRNSMLTLQETNVLIVTGSQKYLDEFLKKLDTRKGYAFRCPEWMAPTITERFRSKQGGSAGVVLLIYSTNKEKVRKYSDPRYDIRTLGEEDANEVITLSGSHWDPSFIREKIRDSAFCGVYQGNEAISWLGTIWESGKACEIGFAYTKEEHRGKGLMKILTSTLTQRILQEEKIPLFHTVETNIPVMKLAESLGYELKAREWAYFYNP
jgi:RimJ/RimL family protein N-acetyltransferase